MLAPCTGRRLTQIGLSRPWPAQMHFVRNKALSSSFRRGVQTQTLNPAVAQRAWGRQSAKRVFAAGAIASLGLGMSAVTRPNVLCEGPSSGGTPSEGGTGSAPLGSNDPSGYPPPPESSVPTFELTFGAVTGICAGVFVKKGAKALAWVLGGAFVLLQYLGSKSLVKVDWGKMANRFENLFYTRDAFGNKKPPNVLSLWRWLVDFLTADFPPRASFLAGFALGLRIG